MKKLFLLTLTLLCAGSLQAGDYDEDDDYEDDYGYYDDDSVARGAWGGAATGALIGSLSGSPRGVAIGAGIGAGIGIGAGASVRRRRYDDDRYYSRRGYRR